jgi:hypothetical protein
MLSSLWLYNLKAVVDMVELHIGVKIILVGLKKCR